MSRPNELLITLVLCLMLTGCVTENAVKEEKGDQMHKKYQVQRAKEQITPTGNWNSRAWAEVEAVEIKHYMGDEPQHKPKTQAKVLYDDDFVYVIFRVEDKYVRAVAKDHQQSVCGDSCVEFFFTPSEDISTGYFNVEMNCGGTMWFSHQKALGVEAELVSLEDCRSIDTFHSEPRFVEPEKQKPTTWIVEYRLPLDLLEKYYQIERPGPNVIWRANFFKCADQTSQPHWLTWSVVDRPRPDFHRPEFFGTLEFK